ncbi:MAG: DUF2800 domain-containing protein [Bdellovibrio sp.]
MKLITEVRCSGLSRLMTCPGSLFFENLPPEEDSAPAKEGTAAGRYLQHLLEGTEPGTHCENGVMFDEDMKFYVTPIAEDIMAEQYHQPDPTVLCEQRIDWPSRSGIMIRGQYDISFVRNGKLHIEDLKYGWGIVDVKENWQLLGYAIGEVIRRQQVFSSIVFKIHQPRPHHEDGPTRTWEISYDELLQYKEKIEDRMLDISHGYRQLVTSAKCLYCPAVNFCPAFNRAFYNTVDYSMSHFQQDDIKDEVVANQLQLIERMEEIVKIKKRSLEQLAVYRINQGGIIPGYILDKSFGDRKWKPGISPKAIETLTGKKIVKEEMMSPAQAEKLGVPKELVATLVDRHFVGMKVKKGDAGKMADKIFNNQKGVG